MLMVVISFLCELHFYFMRQSNMQYTTQWHANNNLNVNSDNTLQKQILLSILTDDMDTKHHNQYDCATCIFAKVIELMPPPTISLVAFMSYINP